jgi:hypothetical protein
MEVPQSSAVLVWHDLSDSTVLMGTRSGLRGNRNQVRGNDGYTVEGHENHIHGTGMIVRGHRNIIWTHRFSRLTGIGNVIVGSDGRYHEQPYDVIGPLDTLPPGPTHEWIDLTVEPSQPPAEAREDPPLRQATGGPIRTLDIDPDGERAKRDRRNARRRQMRRDRAEEYLPEWVTPPRDRLRAAANDAVGRGRSRALVSQVHGFICPSEWPDEPAGIAGTAEELCVICIDRKRATVCLPCGHTCLCVTCSRVQPRRETCVICRALLTEIKRLYS